MVSSNPPLFSEPQKRRMIFFKSIHIVYVILCIIFIFGFYFFSIQYTQANSLTNINGLALFAATTPILLFFIVRMIIVINESAEKYEFYDTAIITLAALIIILPSFTPTHLVESSCSREPAERVITTSKLYRKYFFDYFRYFDKSHNKEVMTITQFCHQYNQLVYKSEMEDKGTDKTPVNQIAFDLSYLPFLEGAFDFGKAGLSERKTPLINKMGTPTQD